MARMLFGIHAWFDPYARLERTSRLEFSRNDRQRRSTLRSVEARTDSRETASRADDCVSLLRLCLYVRFVPRDTWPFPYIVPRKIVISVPVLGKKEGNMSSTRPNCSRAFLERDDGHAGPRANPILSS